MEDTGSDDDVQEKIKAVYAEIERKSKEAEQLSLYLSQQQATALLEEEKEEEDLKRKGIVVGQHIPSLPSKINLDPHRIAEYENFASTVLIAKELMVQNRTNFLRRTGNLPISELAEARKEANMKYSAEMTSDIPHYLLGTQAAEVRKERNVVRFEETIQATKAARTKSLPTQSNDESAVAKQKKSRAQLREMPISAKERLEHEKVLHSINHKLNYLRNPRNDPSSVTKMLVKPKQYFATKQQEQDEAASAGGSVSDTAGLKRKYAKHTSVTDNPLFVCEPSVVLFMDFEVGQQYTHNLLFRNTSAVTRSVRVLPPKSSLFSIAPLRYPNNSVGGMVAPGMSVSTVLTFVPKDLGDFEDFVVVQSESGTAKVRVVAQREPPKLIIPPVIGLPDCLVGDAQRSSLVCTNNGGVGKFVMFSDEVSWQDMESQQASLRIAPFTLYPTCFTLGKGESVEIIIEFVPLVRGLLQRKFFIHCDNGQVREFIVQATSKEVRVTVGEINRALLDFHDPSVYHDLVYRAVPIGADKSQQLVVLNDTGLAVEYEWVWLSKSLSTSELSKAGQKLIRERQQRLLTAEEDDRDSFQPDDSLLRSIKKSLERDRNETVHSSDGENRAVRGSLEIVPARGVIAGEGAAEFHINYAPKAFEAVDLRAVLMIKSIPQAALPSDEQAAHLQTLAQFGHGSFVRLLSWIEDMATVASVPEYRKRSGVPSTSLPLLRLTSVLELVRTQIPLDDECEERPGREEGELLKKEVVSLHKIMHRLLRHVYDSQKNSGFGDDGSSVDEEMSHDERKPAAVIIDLHSWSGESATPPRPMFPYTLPSQLDADVEDDQFESDGENEGAEPGMATDAAAAATMLDGEREKATGKNAQHSLAQVLQAVSQYSDPEQSMLRDVWVDSTNVCRLLGNAICSFLNDKVMHEAVDFLKEGALNHLAALHLNVSAENTRPVLTLHPPIVAVEGFVPLGKLHQAEVTLVNHSQAPVQLQVMKNEFTVRRLYSSHSDDLGEDALGEDISPVVAESCLQLQSEFDYLLVMPQSCERYSFSFSCSSLGRFEISIPVVSADSTAHVEHILVRATITGPKMRFQVAEIDLGLLGVGQEESCTLSFTNTSASPAMFVMKPQLFLETSVLKKNAAQKESASGVTVITSRPNTNRDLPMSARSNISRSSMRSDDFSVADSNATSTDFKIEMKNALVIVDPSSGTIAPNQTLTVQVIGKAGKLPQRIRGMIEARVLDESGMVEVHRQYLNLRGEIQAPKVVLYPMHQNLGQVYVGRPVAFRFTLENICNLPTKFKFLRPGGQSALFSFTLSPTKGSLEAKQRLEVEGVFTALAPGLIDDVLACKMFGISLPLGFSIRALAKGIQLDFQNLRADELPPPPLAPPDAVQFPGGEKPPEPGIIQPIYLGDKVPLYERRSARFVIRNLSAIPAPYEIRPKRFAVIEPKGRKRTAVADGRSVGGETSIASLSTARAVRKDLILAAHEEGRDRFESEAGKKYIGAMVERREDKSFLKSGLGASYLFNSPFGIIPPWGVQEVEVHAFNDIPGCYDDDVEISVQENDIVRKFSIPVRLSVVGCPVVIEPSTVGMTFTSAKGSEELRDQQLLQLGQGCEFGPPLVREFYLRNHGSKSATIKWTVRGIASKMNGPMKLSLQLGKSGKAKCSLRFWDDLAKESPFVIQPASCDIAPYSKSRFIVTLSRSSPAVLERAQLTAKVSVREEEDDGLDDASRASSDQNDALPAGSLSRVQSTKGIVRKPQQQFVLQLLVEGRFVYPQLTIDKQAYSIPLKLTEVPEKEALVMKAKATLLFSGDGKLGKPCSKYLSIANPLEMPLVLTLSTEGALSLKDVQDREPGSATVSASESSTASGKSSVSTSGKSLSLGPYQSTKLIVAFNPRKQLREQLLSTFGTEAGKPTDHISYLVASFPTGQKLRLPVITSISTPFISGSSPRLMFGTCHTRLSCQAVYLLRNPTDVPARWKVAHVPGAGQWRQSTAIRVRGFEQEVVDEDDPLVFSFHPNEGVIEGPTVSVAAAMAAPPKDFNRLQSYIVPERLVESSWANNTLTLNDSLELRHQHRQSSSDSSQTLDVAGSAAAQTCYPLPITITFSPKKNVSYCSRFRFQCEFANTFDVVLHGAGTFEEHEHRPLNPVPR